MAGFHLHTSNRLEILAEELARILTPPLSDPFQREVVVVQSRGMERWARMVLSSRHGICANVWFPFPNALVEHLFDVVCPDRPASPLYERDALTWLVMKHLERSLADPGFDPVRAYVKGAPHPLKSYQLAERLAYLFDQYVVFRPGMILRWEKGESTHWEARLWRRIRQEAPPAHKAARRALFLERMKAAQDTPPGLPERVCVFGLSTLPPFHLGILEALSRHVPVHLFLMNPCREYWADIVSGQEEARILAHGGATGATDLHLQRGNSLLASMGALGREFFATVMDLEVTGHEHFQDPGAATLLHTVQADILSLREPCVQEPAPRTVKRSDDSIQVHACHSPLREVEVLRDRLLDLFERHPDLEPQDVLVMAPDIEVYAPYVQAVFGQKDEEVPAIPFSLADRARVLEEGGLLEAFFRFLDLPHGRFEAGAVLSLLEAPAVRERWGLEPQDLSLIRKWVQESGIAWGMDEGDRETLGLPAVREYTWRFGLDRLLLGFALPEEDALFHGIAPLDLVEGQEALFLGTLGGFVEQGHAALQDLRIPKNPAAWAETLQDILDRFFVTEGPYTAHAQALRSALASISDAETLCGFSDPLALDPVAAFVRRQVEEQAPAQGFLSGGVTFCSMLPMRSIPFQVICILGLGHDAYPRKTERLGFDLMASSPRPGDRSRRKDDRYLFLEALLSARRTFYLSYVGRSIRDNGEIPPSVLVSELLDYLRQGFVPEEDPAGDLLDRIVTQHRLQPFSPAYFDASSPQLFSYDPHHLGTARRLMDPLGQERPFGEEPLAPPGVEWRNLRLDQLLSFFSNPARYFLRERLGVFLDSAEVTRPETEPFVLDNLQQYHLMTRLLEWDRSGRKLQEAYPLVQGQGLLPPGTAGQCSFEKVRDEVRDFSERISAVTGRAAPWEADLDLYLQGFHITGRITDLYGDLAVQFRPAKAKGKDRLHLWLRLLALCIQTEGRINRAILLAKDTTCAYQAPGDPRGILEEILCLYLQGLREPLPFFAETSYLFAQQHLKRGKSPSQALAKVRAEWDHAKQAWQEAKDPHIQICFGTRVPLDETFQALALQMFGPLLQAQEKMG